MENQEIKNFVLTNENYYSQEANEIYLSVSSFKDFKKCEVMALAKIKGEYVEEKSDAFIFGGYVDAYFSNELESYIEENKERLFNSRTGEFKAPFKDIPTVIKTIESDDFFLSFHKGKTQVIITGKISGVLFKAKLDFLFDDKIVDQKILKDLKKFWVEELYKKTDFIEAYGYDIQGAVYQYLAKQRLGKDLPFIIAATTKEDVPDKALIEIDQEFLDKALEEVKELAPRYDLIKRGLVEPVGCGNCPVCRARKKLTRVVSYKEMFNKVNENEQNIE